MSSKHDEELAQDLFDSDDETVDEEITNNNNNEYDFSSSSSSSKVVRTRTPKSLKPIKKKSEEKRSLVFKKLSDEQSERYIAYRRSNFNKSHVKKIMGAVTGSNVNKTISIIMAGMSKVFVGEIVETARTCMQEWGETGPLLPKHIYEAVRRLKQIREPFPYPQYKKRTFRHS
eukprot:TRINITY_DN761_c0_g1_i1.p1 TRINITY_DN761_c0_g1~~TRINITY_DN761_c0_g1_i1.p1  ORF type:complete len:173 (-),score=13.75 TRINITY_DN761_c0_g1_i1:29-547(-)